MESLVRWEPFRELASIQERMNRLLEDFFCREPLASGWEEQLDHWRFAPPADVYEDAHSLTIRIEIPGMEEKDLKVELEGDVLKVQGERKLEKEIRKRISRRRERRYGMFSRSFALPSTVDTQKIEANYARGVLTIKLPKRASTVTKQVKINPAKALPKAA